MQRGNIWLRLGVLAMVFLIALLSGCEKSSKVDTATKQESVPTATESQAEGRIGELIDAWSLAGVRAELLETKESSVLNSMYGCQQQHAVQLGDQQFTVFEYDTENLSSTASRVLDYVDANGKDSKTDDPAWHNQEFLLMNKYSVLKDGEVVNEFEVVTHPQSQAIIEVFQSFK